MGKRKVQTETEKKQKLKDKEIKYKELKWKYDNDFYFKFIVDLLINIHTTIPKELIKDAAMLADELIIKDKVKYYLMTK